MADTEVEDRHPAASVLMRTTGAVVVGYALLRMTDKTEFVPLLLAVGLAVAGLWSVGAIWHHRYTRPVRDLTRALTPVLDPSETDRRIVRVAKRKHGVPTRVVIHYPPTWDDRDEKQRHKVRDIVATRLGGTVEATWRRPRRQVICQVSLSSDKATLVESDTTPTRHDDSVEQARVRTRAADVMQSIMGATATVKDVTFTGDTPDSITVSYGTTSRDLSAHFRQRVIMQLDAKLPGQWRDKWDLENDSVKFELRPPFPSNVFYPLMHKVQGPELPYCVVESGEIEAWKLGSKHPHALVVGPTGSGKTVAIRNLVVGARKLGIPVVICDPKMTEYLDFEGIPGVSVVTDIQDIADRIEIAHDEMMSRYGMIRERKARKGDFGKVLFILDEFFIFKESVQMLWQEMRAANSKLKGREHPCISKWKRMVVLARSAEMHLVVGIQRPDAEFLSGLARDSFRKRISMDRTTPEAARMMWGDSRTGTELPSVQGRAISTTSRGAEEVQVLRLLTPTDDDFTPSDQHVWEALMARMRATELQGTTTVLEMDVTSGAESAELLEPVLAVESEPDGGEAGVADAEAAEAPVEAPALEAAPVGVYELEVGDRIKLEADDEDDLEVLDLHFYESDDGEELVEVAYRTVDGTEGTEPLDMGAEVHRLEVS